MIDDRFYVSHGPCSLGDLIAGLDVGDIPASLQDEMISDVSGLADSKPGHITFLSSKKFAAQFEDAKPTACFIDERHASLAGDADIIPLTSKTPKVHFGRVMQKLFSVRSLNEVGQIPPQDLAENIHPTAIIASTAVIGENVQVGPFTVIGPGVVIGAHSVIGSHVSIDCALIGEGCHIKPQAVIGGRGFGVNRDENGYLDIPHIGRVIMGDGVSVGSQSCIDRGFLEDTILEDDVKIDNLVQIAHNVQIGAGTMMAAHVGISGSCRIGKNVVMGGNVGLADHLSVGDGAQLAARAGVMHNVPAGEVWSGIPAQPIRDHMRIIAATRKLIKKKV